MGCFKPGRYPHLKKTNRKRESLTVYMLIEDLIPEKSRLKDSMITDAEPFELPVDPVISSPCASPVKPSTRQGRAIVKQEMRPESSTLPLSLRSPRTLCIFIIKK